MQTNRIETRRTTLDLPVKLLEAAQEETGAGISKTVAAGLEKIVHASGYRKLLDLEGAVDLRLDLDQLREDRAL